MRVEGITSSKILLFLMTLLSHIPRWLSDLFLAFHPNKISNPTRPHIPTSPHSLDTPSNFLHNYSEENDGVTTLLPSETSSNHAGPRYGERFSCSHVSVTQYSVMSPHGARDLTSSGNNNSSVKSSSGKRRASLTSSAPVLTRQLSQEEQNNVVATAVSSKRNTFLGDLTRFHLPFSPSHPSHQERKERIHAPG